MGHGNMVAEAAGLLAPMERAEYARKIGRELIPATAGQIKGQLRTGEVLIVLYTHQGWELVVPILEAIGVPLEQVMEKYQPIVAYIAVSSQSINRFYETSEST